MFIVFLEGPAPIKIKEGPAPIKIKRRPAPKHQRLYKFSCFVFFLFSLAVKILLLNIENFSAFYQLPLSFSAEDAKFYRGDCKEPPN